MTYSNIPNDKPNASRNDLGSILNTGDTPAKHSRSVSPTETPFSLTASASKDRAAAAFFDLGYRSRVGPIREPSHQQVSRYYTGHAHQEGDPVCEWQQHSRHREDGDGIVRKWNGKMLGNKRVYERIGRYDEDGNLVRDLCDQDSKMIFESHKAIPRPPLKFNERELVYGPDPRNPCPVSGPEVEKDGDETEDEAESKGKASVGKKGGKTKDKTVWDRLARRSIWDSYYPDQEWNDLGSLDEEERPQDNQLWVVKIR